MSMAELPMLEKEVEDIFSRLILVHGVKKRGSGVVRRSVLWNDWPASRQRTVDSSRCKSLDNTDQHELSEMDFKNTVYRQLG